jgi:hypothetical protein
MGMLDVPLLPFSAVAERAFVETASQRLLETLGLKAQAAVVEATPRQAIASEGLLRRRWWSGQHDDFRDALHAAKFRAYSAPGKQHGVTQAWREMGEHIRSSEWRNHVRKLTAPLAEPDALSLRIAFGAAAQAWTRAARWHAAFGSEPNPFAQVAELFGHCCWPWGVRDGVLRIGCVLTQRSAADSALEDSRCVAGAPGGSSIFLSAPFREPSSRAIAGQIEAKGWHVIHRQVDERIAPEIQLGVDIDAAATTVCALVHPDPDFGIPWWMFQELDFAAGRGRPVALLGECRIKLLYPELEIFPVNRGIIDEGFWPWLESKAAPR